MRTQRSFQDYISKNKDPYSIGKFRRSFIQQNPEEGNKKKLENISTNTPRILNLSPPCSELSQSKPQIKRNSYFQLPRTQNNNHKGMMVYPKVRHQASSMNNREQLPNKNQLQKIRQDNRQYYIGRIKYKNYQNNKIERMASSQLPYIDRINNNMKVFKDFIGNSSTHSQQTQTHNLFINAKSAYSQILSKDPNFQKSLTNHRKKQFLHLPMFNYDANHDMESHPQENINKQDKVYFQINKKHKDDLSQHQEKELINVGSNTNFMIKNRQNNQRLSYSRCAIDESIVIGINTQVNTLKRILVQSENHLDVSFRIPDSFMSPLSIHANQKQLHELMIEILSYASIKPQIISIYKFANCVIMRSKKICILWHFNGRVYFGGWLSQTIGEGKKEGLGLEFVPQRYVYYGEFKDGKKQGYGIMKKYNKQVYVGLWKNNQRNGWGKIFNPEGNLVQNGEFQDGRLIKQGYLH